MSESLQRARGRRAGLRAAMSEVESAIAGPVTGREADWRRELAAHLDRLAHALESHIAGSEAPDGLLAEIIESAPRLANQVKRARAEHVALRAEVGEAQAAAAAGATGRDLRDQVVALLADLVRHRQMGADLIYEAYSVDIEAAD